MNDQVEGLRAQRAQTRLLSFSVTAIVLGLIALYFGSVGLVHEVAAASLDSRTVGTVSDSYPYYAHKHTRRHKDCTTSATYIVDGREYEVRSEKQRGCPFDEGAQVEVRYSSADPSNALMSTGDPRPAVVAFLSGLAAIGLGTAALVRMSRRTGAAQPSKTTKDNQ